MRASIIALAAMGGAQFAHAQDAAQPIIVGEANIVTSIPDDAAEALIKLEQRNDVDLPKISPFQAGPADYVRDALGDMTLRASFEVVDVTPANYANMARRFDSFHDNDDMSVENRIAQETFGRIDGLYPYATDERLTFNFGRKAEAGRWSPELTVQWDNLTGEDMEAANQVLRGVRKPEQADYTVTVGFRLEH